MEDNQDVEDKQSEEVSESASQKKQETREEMLSRHRWCIHDRCLFLHGLMLWHFFVVLHDYYFLLICLILVYWGKDVEWDIYINKRKTRVCF